MTALSGKRALVTGGTRGIGAATARAFALAGATVAITGRDQAVVQAAAAALGSGHLAVVADLSKLEAVSGLRSQVSDWCEGAPDILVNNAGTFPQSAVESQDLAELSRTLRLNVEAPFALMRAFLPAMRKRGSGDIVTIGSIADRTAFPEGAAYSASKFGMRGVHEVLRAETRGTGVRAILVSPGPVDTEIWDQYEASIGTRFPAREAMLVADDVARAILFAVSQPAHVDVVELRLNRS